VVGEKIAEKELVKDSVVIILVAHPSASTNFRERHGGERRPIRSHVALGAGPERPVTP
jgi:hypothetical protein